MVDAWGVSWGNPSAWGTSWQASDPPPPSNVVLPESGPNGMGVTDVEAMLWKRWLDKRRAEQKKATRKRDKDTEDRESFREIVLRALHPDPVAVDDPEIEPKPKAVQARLEDDGIEVSLREVKALISRYEQMLEDEDEEITMMLLS